MMAMINGPLMRQRYASSKSTFRLSVVTYCRNQKKARFVDDNHGDPSDDEIDYSRLDQVPIMCMTLASAPQNSQKDCVGFVLDEKCTLWGTYCVACKSGGDIEKHCLSLENVLSHPSQCLNKRECLSLAVNLASSLLQLHATPWLQENWCDKSIYFPRARDVRRPYVVVQSNQSLTTPEPRPAFGPNPYLLSLGIVLLELSERKPFSQWIQEMGYSEVSDNVLEKARIAWEWFDAAYGNMSEEYARAVEHCLSSVFVALQHKKTLTDEGFRDAVFRDIVQRLEREYSRFVTHQ